MQGYWGKLWQPVRSLTKLYWIHYWHWLNIYRHLLRMAVPKGKRNILQYGQGQRLSTKMPTKDGKICPSENWWSQNIVRQVECKDAVKSFGNLYWNGIQNDNELQTANSGNLHYILLQQFKTFSVQSQKTNTYQL